jgi:hypothetical protein
LADETMRPYEAENAIAILVKVWIKEKLDRLSRDGLIVV